MSSTKQYGRSMETFGTERQLGNDEVAITVASPEAIRSWSKGEVKYPETINYRTFKPEKGGLFCERIFGPTRDWECSCGKFKRIKNKGTTCDRCGVEVTLARVRRERMGHIELAVPVSHIWFYKCTPSRLGLILNLTSRELERVLYYEDYIVVDPGKTGYKKLNIISEDEFIEAENTYGEDSFKAMIGAEAIQKLLEEIDLPKLAVTVEKEMNSTKSKQLRRKHAQRLKLVQGFIESKTRPEWMILNSLPVIPPDLRPLVPLDGGRFATSDLNDLYRRVINRNNRLKQLMAIKTPEVIIRNEKRMLQEAVDALFDNGRHGRAVAGASNRPLKSLSDTIKGKSGRFRQNLLGKRVDYSGRSVIVIGPELQLHQCGLPKKMALVLFEPFIIRKLKDRGYAHTVRSAKKLIEQQTKEVWDILEEVTKGHPVLLNRAPTLHRLSIQAFEPQLIEGEAIRIHPLVCTAYNADFDGDQMAVHVPLSVEAQMEARMLMLAPNNIFSPSSGKPITNPSQDIPLGCYYMTQIPQNVPAAEKDARLPLFANWSEVDMAYVEGKVRLHSRIRLKNPDLGKDTVYGDKNAKVIETTVGRVSFNQIWPEGIGFINKVCGKKQLSEIIWKCYKLHGQAETVRILDRLKEYGFRSATKAGISIGINDMIIPEEKKTLIEKAYAEVATVENQYRAGIITDGERKNKLQDIWSHASEELANAVDRTLKHNHGSTDMNPVFMMVDSGARGNRTQVKQLAGMRGLMAKPSGEIIERPILANFREGLSVLEYFISTHGARKGLADTALKTADSGYLTRKLVDAAQDVIITEADCGTVNGIVVQPVYQGDTETVTLAQRTIGRTSCQTIKDPVSEKVIVKAGQIVDEDIAAALDNLGIEKLKIRSALTCECRRGICAACYGRNLATGRPVKLGEAVGIIAAQSIGEPGTQLTMRTFHIGGTASQTFKQPTIKARNTGTVHYLDLKTVTNAEGKNVVLNKNGYVEIRDKDGQPVEDHSITLGSIISIPDGGAVKKGETFITWDQYSVPIITEKAGKVTYVDLMPGVTIRRETDETTGMKGTVVIEHKEDLHPQIVINGDDGTVLATYSIPAGAHIEVKANQRVEAGTRLARTPRKIAKTKDITGGLPRVAELFEARRPKEAAEIAKIDGIVDIEAGTVRGKRRIVVRDTQTGAEEEHIIPISMHVIVFKGDRVEKGQPLTEGSVGSQEILEICGAHELQERLLNEVQDIYRSQGVEINDKHIEIIVRQMLRKVRITEPGGTSLLWGEQVDRQVFDAANAEARAKDEPLAKAQPVLLGITRASLETDSFISAASFQDTTRVLTEAATLGKVDKLRGFKENVIMGHLIPAGTGFKPNREVELAFSETAVFASASADEPIPFGAEPALTEAPRPKRRGGFADAVDSLSDEVAEVFADTDMGGFDDDEAMPKATKAKKKKD